MVDKEGRFQINEMDYFGSYVKMTEMIQTQQELPPEDEGQRCIIVLSKIHLDLQKQ